MKKAIFLDRDGVIVHDKGYMHKTKDVSLIEGSAEAIKLFNEAGYVVVIVSNQAGIARGLFKEKDVDVFNKELLKQLKALGAHIDKVYYCPHHPTDGVVKEYSIICECRKPSPGMLTTAAKEHGIDMANSWMVGDRQSDIDAGKKAGCNTIFIGKDAKNLLEASHYILENCSPQLDEPKIVSVNEIEKLVSELKKKGKTIVFTNGCFDILHFGHVYYLKEAKKRGDILIIGLNSNRSVQKMKGNGRPINGELERACVLTSLACVDYVVIFDEDVPIKLVERIQPHVYVKGSDWKDKNIPEKKLVEQNGGTVVFIPLAIGFSTTKLIEKIKKG